MSQHRNPDTSITEGFKSEPNGVFCGHTLAVAIVTAQPIGASVAAALALGAQQAIIQVDGTAAVSYTLDGTTPTTAAGGGLLIPAGGSIVLNMTDAAAAKFIQRAATSVLNVTYTM